MVLLNFGYLPKDNLIKQLKQLTESLNYVIDKYDYSNLYITADSSGAYLASILAFIWNNEKIQKKYGINLPKVKLTAVGLVGNPCTINIFPKFLFNYYKKNKELLLNGNLNIEKELNYNNLADNCDCNVCPIFLMSGKGDIYYKNNIEFEKWLTTKNFKHEYCFITECKVTHCFNVIRPDYDTSKKANDAMLKFFKEVK